jgi:hypothetical protein
MIGTVCQTPVTTFLSYANSRKAHFFLVFQEFRYSDFTVLGIWLFGPSNRLTRYDWDRLPNARDDFFELSEFPDSSFFSTRILVRVQ